VSFSVSRQRLHALVEGFAGRRLLVVGDFVVDRFITGHPKRISREAPVLILRFSREEAVPGGGANTVANIASLGGRPVPVGGVGDDAEGTLLADLFGKLGVDASHLIRLAGYRTPVKTRILAGAPHAIKQQVVRYDREDVLPEDAGPRRALAREVERAGHGVEAAVLADYGYGSVRPDMVPAVRAAVGRGPILVDSRFSLALYRGVDAATPNEEELEAATPVSLGDSDAAVAAAGAALRRTIGCRTLLVTRGSRGMMLFDADDPPVSIPVHGTDQVADVTGAGDTVIATLALAISAGAQPLEAAILANLAGGIVVMKMGTATATPEQLHSAVDETHLLP
jgi:D-glycero-beta-D-manno-heptose-7-phosphate kinase